MLQGMDSRQRMIEATLRLLRRQGLRATGMNQIVSVSSAPRGSIYHHFPGGKEQLVVEVLWTAGQTVANRIRDALETHGTVAEALQAYLLAYAEEIRLADFERGCPVGNVAMDAAATSPTLRQVCDEIFRGWAELIARRLEREGHKPVDAAALAQFVISAIEGALILCRASRSTQPLEGIAARLERMLAPAPQSRRMGRPRI